MNSIFYTDFFSESGNLFPPKFTNINRTDANRRLAMLWGAGDTVKNPEGSTVGVFHNTTDDEQIVDLSSATNYEFSKIVAAVGFSDNSASLDGQTLTIAPQTSVVLK